MVPISHRSRIFTIAVLVLALTVGHNFGIRSRGDYLHHFYHACFFLPLILSAFWFGLKGALATSLTITLLNLPEVVAHFEKFSPLEFEYMLQMGIYNVMAVCLGLLRDRERREQKRSLEAGRLAAIGRAMSCVAHDMKTPLIAIGGFSQMLMKHFDAGDPNLEKLEIIVKETRRLEMMVKEMLDFSRPLELHRSREDMCLLIEESLAVVNEVASTRGVIIFCTPSSSPLISLDPLRIKQVLINLMINAVEASPAGETVTVAAYRKGRSIIVDVSDKGEGIPNGKTDEIFSPFYTTKKEGTGLGLPIARKIVEAHDGRLELLQNSGRGLIFRVRLPIG
jgi:two-component system, NtrC family, sensor histidine kinase HydH